AMAARCGDHRTMFRSHFVVLLAAVVGSLCSSCATAGAPEDGSGGRRPDGSLPDASGAVADAGVDARPAEPDCIDTELELLSNPGFDQGPGSGWVEQASVRLIRRSSEMPIAAHTGTHGVWMGGGNRAN